MVVLTALLLIAGTIALSLYLYYKKSFKYWKDRGFTHTIPGIPWGDIKGANFTISIGESITNIYNQFPKERFAGMWMLYKPALLVRDPELVKSIFVRDFMNFHDRGISFNEELDPLAGHLFIISGTKWRNLRVKLSPTFTSGKMKMMFPIMTECSKQFSKVLEEPAKKGQVIEVKDYAARFTTDIISSAAFGLETNSLNTPDSEFRRFGQKIFDVTSFQAIKNLVINFCPGIGTLFSLKQIPMDVENFFMTTLRDTIAYRNENKIKRNDFLDLLMQLMSKGYIEDVDGEHTEITDNNKFTFEEAAAQAFVFFVAGFETSSTTMQFALYELARHPEIQQKAREEVKTTLKKHNGELTYDCVMEMSYLGRVIDETLRVYPPVPFLQRECNKDYPIPGTDLVLPKGVVAIIPALGLHRDPEHYPNPSKFDPDRFLEEEKAKRHHYSYLPFGEGPRNCIGMRFGLLQTRAGLITLLNKYEFTVAAETPIPMVYDPKAFILTPEGGMNLKITEYKE